MDGLPRPSPSPRDTELDTCVCGAGDCMWVCESEEECVWGGGYRLGGPVNKEGLNHPFAFCFFSSSSLFFPVSLSLCLFLGLLTGRQFQSLKDPGLETTCDVRGKRSCKNLSGSLPVHWRLRNNRCVCVYVCIPTGAC